jgi:membrane-anchored protein YejM (alkaline phosphatase superfamily)
LVGFIKSQAVTTAEELLEVKERITADSGVSFTPRKKPHFSNESTYKYVEPDVLPTIKEAPSSPAVIQEHMMDHWSAMVTAVKILKEMSHMHLKPILHANAGFYTINHVLF